jgi:hypothetical protein
MWAISCKLNSIRCYVIKLEPAAFYYVQNTFIDVSTESDLSIFSVYAELIGEYKNVNYVGYLQKMYPVKLIANFNPEHATNALRGNICKVLLIF